MTIRENEIILDGRGHLTIRTGQEWSQPGVVIIDPGDLRIQERALSKSRPGRIDGTRELVITGTSYILPYRVRHDAIEILAAAADPEVMA